MINCPTLVVYVAGASSEFQRPQKWIARLRDAGVIVPYDWTQMVEYTSRRAQKESDLHVDERFYLAERAQSAVEDADLLWGLIPTHPNTTSGMWFEMGVARCNKKTIVVSGDWKRSIFTELADRKFIADEDAANFILKIYHDRKLLISGRLNDSRNGTGKGS